MTDTTIAHAFADAAHARGLSVTDAIEQVRTTDPALADQLAAARPDKSARATPHVNPERAIDHIPEKRG